MHPTLPAGLDATVPKNYLLLSQADSVPATPSVEKHLAALLAGPSITAIHRARGLTLHIHRTNGTIQTLSPRATVEGRTQRKEKLHLALVGAMVIYTGLPHKASNAYALSTMLDQEQGLEERREMQESVESGMHRPGKG